MEPRQFEVLGRLPVRKRNIAQEERDRLGENRQKVTEARLRQGGTGYPRQVLRGLPALRHLVG